jgi:hypothetical protein
MAGDTRPSLRRLATMDSDTPNRAATSAGVDPFIDHIPERLELVGRVHRDTHDVFRQSDLGRVCLGGYNMAVDWHVSGDLRVVCQ